MNARTVAAKSICQVIYHGRSLTDVLNSEMVITLPDNEKSLVKNICFGSLRWHYQLSALVNILIPKPIKKKDKDIECVIRIGLYQIIYQQTPDHAAVNETVAAAKPLKKPWSRGLINGVLRSYLRDKENLLEQSRKTASSAYNFPDWLLGKLKKAWPNDWKAIIEASNNRAPMTIRVNLSRNSREEYLQALLQNEIHAKISTEVNSAIVLNSPISVDQLSGFFRGDSSVQDAAAQLAAMLLDCKPHMRVLDACAAPGGKTGHILELDSTLKVTAIDSDPSRLTRVKENLDRLNTKANLVEADANKLSNWYDNQAYDRILLDAPCSATGVIRRHPDIKVLRQADDIKALVKQQNKLLENLWSILKPGGELLYATCSILPEENDKQINNFLDQQTNAEVIPIKASWGIPQKYGRQIFPGTADMDGFYYCLIKKNNAI